MNAWIETEVRRDPTQYLWMHKRFKTRPPGEPGLYDFGR
jgi:KDO2-lipid IV(A) lauroyltransferase